MMACTLHARHLPVGIGDDLDAVMTAIEATFSGARTSTRYDHDNNEHYLVISNVANKTTAREIAILLGFHFRAYMIRHRRASAPWRWERIEVDIFFGEGTQE